MKYQQSADPALKSVFRGLVTSTLKAPEVVVAELLALGYFGYDWKTENEVSIEMAEPLSLNQIQQRYIESCPSENCLALENDDLESVIKYTDSEGFSHEVWFENEKSANKKIKFLNSKGINQIASWAYSYY